MTNTEITQILNFFLDIYRRQVNCGPGSPAGFEPMDIPCQGSDAIYELRVCRNGNWLTRRMTLGPLGEDSGSKSSCYKVIYDDTLVIKIPPTPITDFNKYLDSIRRERRIADRLTPTVECVTPTLSAILGKVPPFYGKSFASPGDLEDQCIAKLTIMPEYQDHLKIGGGFVFFMNLSKHAFLGQVLADIHEIKNKLKREITAQADILLNPLALGEIYGNQFSPVFFAISDVYKSYEGKLNRILKYTGPYDISAYNKREWFLMHLSEEGTAHSHEYVSPDLLTALNRVLNKTIEENREVVEKYRKVMAAHIYRKTFKQHKEQMGGIIANVLRLLARLRENGVAMRDLKPDNVFIVGDIEGSPLLLTHPEGFDIGLIDFETAVEIRTEAGDPIEQPMLAGTPSYATPSHLFTNELLSRIYTDVGRILHLQDWQAVNSMIYNIITGKRLAQETSKLMPGIVKIIRKSVKKNLPKEALFRHCSQVFWHNASGEFRQKLSNHRQTLQSIQVVIPAEVRRMLFEEAITLRSDIIKRVQAQIHSQDFFKSPKSRRSLIRSSPEVLAQCREKWESGMNAPKLSPSVKTRVIELLENIEFRKRQSEELESVIRLMEQDRPGMTAYELLKLMFSVVFNTMYKAEWGELSDLEKPKSGAKTGGAMITYEETIALEDTITRACIS